MPIAMPEILALPTRPHQAISAPCLHAPAAAAPMHLPSTPDAPSMYFSRTSYHPATPATCQTAGRVLGQRLPYQPRWDGAGRSGSPPPPQARTRPARRPERAGRRRTGLAGMSGTSVRRAVRRPRNGTKRARIGKASGSTDRSFGPDAVRYMSVTIATPCPTAAHDDTRRDKKETARRAAFPQRAGRFRRWWQVLGSNQRRLSRRFYSPSLLPEVHSADQHIRRSRRRPAPPPSAMRPCVPGLVHGRGRKNPRTGAVGAVTPTVRPAFGL